jgi:uncharacterized protein (DUF2237 family)
MGLFIFLIFALGFDISTSKTEQINVFGKKLEQCSISPMTGYYRSGMELFN